MNTFFNRLSLIVPELSQHLISLIESIIIPPGLFVVILAMAVLFWRFAIARIAVLCIALCLYFLSTDRITASLASNLETYPPITAKQTLDQGAQAIVVFLADAYTNAPELNGGDALMGLSLERLSYAATLHQKTALPIIVCGGIIDHNKQTSLAGTAAKTLINLFNITPLAIEEKSKNTWGNAHELVDILKKHSIKKIALVTHAWHMPRAIFSLQHAKIDAIAAPAYYYSKYQYIMLGSPGGIGGLGNWLPRAKYFYASINMLHERIGLLWYRLTKA